MRFAFLDRTTRGEQEAVPADFEVGDLVAQDLVGQFAIEGLQPSRTPAFAEPNVFEAFGVVMFTYAFIVTVPSWVNEKKPAVSVKKVMWTSALTCSLLQLAFGLLGAWAFDLVGPKATCTKSDCQNILLIFDHPDMPVITRYSSYLFMLTTLVPGIPVLAIAVRYNLQSSGLCSFIVHAKYQKQQSKCARKKI